MLYVLWAVTIFNPDKYREDSAICSITDRERYVFDVRRRESIYEIIYLYE